MASRLYSLWQKWSPEGDSGVRDVEIDESPSRSEHVARDILRACRESVVPSDPTFVAAVQAAACVCTRPTMPSPPPDVHAASTVPCPPPELDLDGNWYIPEDLASEAPTLPIPRFAGVHAADTIPAPEAA